ncbi:hypothetical protein [Pseudomonas panipatensis]|uniref:hypothetical protein n=1 Tax=Pseudomonas panipatensis TaxID=428992 RepID=UPI0035B16E55
MSELENVHEVQSDKRLSKAECEVRLAIADYAIRRMAGTPAGYEAFQALVAQFQGRYPHHKLLTQLLIAPECIDVENLSIDRD